MPGPQTVRAGTLAFGFFFIFGAIGFYYRSFNQVADEEVIEMLNEQAP
jgi:predicted phosphoribosyltransferase